MMKILFDILVIVVVDYYLTLHMIFCVKLEHYILHPANRGAPKDFVSIVITNRNAVRNIKEK